MCQVAIAVDMSRCAAPPPNLCSLKPPQFSGCPAKLFGFGFGFDIHRKHRLKRRLKFVVAAELSKPFSSLSFGFDSQVSIYLNHLSESVNRIQFQLKTDTGAEFEGVAAS